MTINSSAASDIAAAREALYADVARFGMGPLWTVYHASLTPEPRARNRARFTWHTGVRSTCRKARWCSESST